MNNEEKLKAALKNDTALRDAIKLDEMEAPKMAADLNARLMKRMAAEAPVASRTRKLWPWIAAACAIAFIAVIATPPKSDTQATEMVAKVEPATQPVAPAAEQSAVVAPAAVTPAIVVKASPKVSKAIQKAPKTAAPAKPEAIEPAVEHILAAATTAQPAEAKEKKVIMSERDIPITRPENYKYTPEELAQLKKQAAEAYLKWVELEMEISRNNLEQALK